MKFSYSILFSIFILFSCKSKTENLNENYSALGFVSRGEEIKLGNNLFMNTQKISLIIFIYHDTVFQVEIENNKSTYSYIKSIYGLKDTLMSVFKPYRETTLKKQLQEMNRNGYRGSCAGEGYFLFNTDEKINFGIFHVMHYYRQIERYNLKKIDIDPNKFPKIYQSIYFAFNSHIWDYFMSDDFYYKNVRTFGKSNYLSDPIKE